MLTQLKPAEFLAFLSNGQAYGCRHKRYHNFWRPLGHRSVNVKRTVIGSKSGLK